MNRTFKVHDKYGTVLRDMKHKKTFVSISLLQPNSKWSFNADEMEEEKKRIFYHHHCFQWMLRENSK